MVNSRLVCVNGLLGSGKTTLVERLVLEEGYESRCVGEELARLYREDNGLSTNAPVPGLERMTTHKRLRLTDPTYIRRFILDGTYENRAIDGLRNYDDALQVV